MGSTCYLKFKSINPERFSLLIQKGDESKEELDCTMHSEFEIHFHLDWDYTISFLPGGPRELWKSPFGYLTVRSVSDFCWMVLSFASYFRNSIQIIESRPDPFFMLQHALDTMVQISPKDDLGEGL